MSSPSILRIAAAQYGLTQLGSWEAYVQKRTQWIEKALVQKAQLLVFPEYSGLELVSLLSPPWPDTALEQCQAIQSFLPAFIELHQAMAQRYDITLIAGTVPVRVSQDQFVNRAFCLTSTGACLTQDKHQLTPFERSLSFLVPGEAPRVLETPHGPIGIAICYDSEFPMQVHALAHAGAQVIIVPSCTETLAGSIRVQTACRARALENQCVVVQSALVGNNPWLPMADVNIGTAGIYVPMDTGFPDDGILAQGRRNQRGWVTAKLDFTQLDWVRRHGQVRLFTDSSPLNI